MTIARRYPASEIYNNYWLIRTDNYGLSNYCPTLKDAFSSLDDNSSSLFDITSEYFIKDGFMYPKREDGPTDIILVNHPTDLTYKEFCELYPELFI